jgi:hypothetical protein
MNFSDHGEEKVDLYNLSYKYEDKKTYFSSLHLKGKNETREIILVFVKKKELNASNFWDAESGKDENVTKIDHMSFHSDGNILLSYYNPKKQHFSERKLKYPISKLPDNNYIPLIIISVNNLLNHSKYIGLPRIFDKGENVADLMWDVKNEPFSIGVFIFRNDCDPLEILNIKFPDIFITSDTAWFPYAINKNTGMLLAFSKKLVLPKDNNFINPKYLDKDGLKFEQFPVMGMSLVPSDKRINQLSH